MPIRIAQVNLAGDLTWQGAWTTGHNYALNNMVTNANNCYVCISGITNSTTVPGSDPTHFALVATSGAGFNFKGAWASGQNYALNDVVTYLGSSYNCILAITNSTTVPSADPTHFTLMTAAGTSSGAPVSLAASTAPTLAKAWATTTGGSTLTGTEDMAGINAMMAS